jgi:hypothetical protein
LVSQHRPDAEAEGLISILKCLKLNTDIIFQSNFIAHLERSNARDHANPDSGPATNIAGHSRPIWVPDPCSFRVLDCSTNVDYVFQARQRLVCPVRRAETFSVRNKMAAIKFEKSFVDPGGFWLSYQDSLHSERGYKCIFPLK